MTLLAAPTTTSVAAERGLLEVERLEPSIGARVHGVDLSRVTDGQVRAIRTALAEYKVLFFAGQHDLHPDSQIALGRRLGEVTESHPVVPGVDEQHPEIYALDSATGGFADIWHTDVTFVRRPPLGSVLRAVVLPPTGGDTQWADLELAYRSLSGPVQRLADQLVAVHDGTREFGYYIAQREERTKWEGEEYRALVPGISDPQLTLRLKQLQGRGLIERTVIPSTPVQISSAPGYLTPWEVQSWAERPRPWSTPTIRVVRPRYCGIA